MTGTPAGAPAVFVDGAERPDTPAVADEMTALSAWLDWHRVTLVSKLDGLTEEQVRWSPVPSGTSLLGLVKHLTETEHGWFVTEYAQLDEPPPFETPEDPEAGFRAEPHETIAGLVAGYRAICERARALVAGASPDETVPNARRGRVDLRRIMIHMVEETARHNGHADIIREMIDGSSGD
jgi:uncharacterized damage-inducible protein DinB